MFLSMISRYRATFCDLKKRTKVILNLSFFYSSIVLDSHWICLLTTPFPSAPVRCTPVAPPTNKVAEIASPVPCFASPGNKWICFLPWSWRGFIPGGTWKNCWPPMKRSILSMAIGLQTISSTWLWRFCIKSSAMDTWYLVSLV